jgi:DNA-binding response OmpR family regulator
MEAAADKPKILIIDDSPTIRLIVKSVFEPKGFDVMLATDGSEGVRQALMNPPNIIVLDIMMEGLHGFEVCKMLRTNSKLNKTAIIVVSGKSFKPDIDKAIQLGADEYVVKPFAKEEFYELALRCMNNRMSQP